MRSKNRFIIILFGLLLAGFSGVLFFFSDFIVQATHDPNGSNIYGGVVDDPLDQLHWAWNDAIGWIDFHSTLQYGDIIDIDNPYIFNVIVKSKLIEGYASSSAKELSLDCATSRNGNICSSGNDNFRVLNNGCGALSGWAWNEVYGWASFCGTNILADGSAGCPYNPNYSYRVTITNGEFSGYAWSDVVGWISFNCSDGGYCGTSNYKVKTTWTSSSTSAYLDSRTFDTGVPGGAQLNSIMWLGGFTSATSTCAGTTVKVGFQIAATSTPSGPWNFIGPDNTSSTFYEAFPVSEPGVSIPLDYTLHNNQRYFRYRVFLFSDQSQSQSPRVDDVIINWSP